MKLPAIFLLALALVVEVSLTTVPLVFLLLLCLTVVLQEEWLFIAAFFCGLLLDLMSFRTLGTSSIFLTTFLFLALLYQSKFEITTGYFVTIASFLGSLLFLLLVGYTHLIIIQAIASSVIAIIMFEILKKITKSKFLISNS